MEQIILAYGLPRETVVAIIMLYKNKKVKVRLPEGDTGFFDIVVSTSDVDRFYERKWPYTGKSKKQTIPLTNY